MGSSISPVASGMISVVIPSISLDEPFGALVQDLQHLVDSVGEILIVVPNDIPLEVLESWNQRSFGTSSPIPVRLVKSARGRASQQNAGVLNSSFPWIWFLHADSRLELDDTAALRRRLRNVVSTEEGPDFFYMDLKLKSLSSSSNGSVSRSGEWKRHLPQLNNWGARLRSDLLRLPFGDQGFLVRKTLFASLGGFTESLQVGEDHNFVWRLRHSGGRLKRLGFSLQTSSRKYETRGWLKATVQTLNLTWQQARPEIWRATKSKLRAYDPAADRQVAPVACAVFVKTPGLSPIKTRLAATVGVAAAEDLYCDSLRLLTEILDQVKFTKPGFHPVWAVAEPNGVKNPLWAGWNKVVQPTGDLGFRMSDVFDRLQSEFGSAILLGADVPSVREIDLTKAVDALRSPKPTVVWGPAKDGGFYLFGCNRPLPKSFWLDVVYGGAEVYSTLSQRLSNWTADKWDRVILPERVDLDEFGSIAPLIREISQLVEEPEASLLLQMRHSFQKKLSSLLGGV